MARVVFETGELDRYQARVWAERLLTRRKACQDRIVRINRKLVQLSKKYGLNFDLDGNLIQEDSIV
ncbi:MAG: hypothetical protein JTT11_03205 [Candidatus Brockarchaeota archaeon]|nr:hypothetical protein [Candidatus Brockarchaeota archaeon]